MLRVQRAQPPYGTIAAPDAGGLTGVERGMSFGHEAELRSCARQSEQRFDIRLHVEEIDFRRFRAPLLRQRRARDHTGDHFSLLAVGAAVATSDFEQAR